MIPPLPKMVSDPFLTTAPQGGRMLFARRRGTGEVWVWDLINGGWQARRPLTPEESKEFDGWPRLRKVT